MSLDLVVTKLDLDRFRAAQGSGDRELLRAILEARRQELADHDAIAAVGASRIVSLATLIEQIILGQVALTGIEIFRYEHAAAQIADALGTLLNAEIFAETHPEFWSDVDRLISQARCGVRQDGASWPTLAELLERGPLLNVPLDPHYRLGTGFITAPEARSLTGMFERLELNDLPILEKLEWADETLEAVETYQDWVRSAAAAGEGLFVHC